MKPMLVPAALAAALSFVAPVHAGNTMCQASVQDAHGIATGWIGTDGQQVVPLKGTFVFPPAQVALKPEAKGYTLGKPAKFPQGTLFLSAQYDFDQQGGDTRIRMDKVEVDGPTFMRPDGTPAHPMFLMTPDGDAMVREEAALEDDTFSLRLYPRDGKSSQGDIYVLPEERAALAKLFEPAGDVVVAAADLGGPSDGPVYQGVLHMTDQATVNAMIAAAMKQAAAAAPSGTGCTPM